MQENCTDITWYNATVGFPQHNLDMLTGAGQWAGLAAQITYNPAVYAQIPAMAFKGWKALPNKGAGEQLRFFEEPQNLILSLLTTCYHLRGCILGGCGHSYASHKTIGL